MTKQHARHRARGVATRTQAGHFVVLSAMAGRRPRGRARGFSIVELVLSFVIFLVMASVISLAMARSFSTATVARDRSQATVAIGDELNKLAAQPFEQLQSGAFTVPDACANSGPSISGFSCVRAGTSYTRIGYGYTPDTPDPNNPCGIQDASKVARRGYVRLTACLLGTGRGSLSETSRTPVAGFDQLTRQVNAPRAGYAAGSGTVRVQLTGAFAALPGGYIQVINPARIDSSGAAVAASPVATAQVDSGGVANIPVAAGACSTARPCALALSVGTTPTMASGGGASTLALSATTAAGPSAGFTVTPGAVTELAATVAATASASLDLQAVNGSVVTANPVKGSVCVWVTFPDGTAERTVPVCNTRDPGKLIFDTYDPAWPSYAKLSASALAAVLANGDSHTRYPFPSATTLRLSIDNPDGSCPYAPGMVGSSLSSPTAPDTAWSPQAICTSFTWGLPSVLRLSGAAADLPVLATGTALTLSSGTVSTGALVWNNPLLAPAAVGYLGEQSWVKPRTAAGCSTDASCTSTFRGLGVSAIDPSVGTATASYPSSACVADGSCRSALALLSPETKACPSLHCYSNANAAPFVSSPAALTYHLNSGAATTFTVAVRDSDDPSASLSAAITAPQAGTSVSTSAATVVDGHTVSYQVTFTDTTNDGKLKPLRVAVTGGSGSRAKTVTSELGLYYTDGPWQLSADPVTVVQGAANVPIKVRVSGTSGAGYSGASLSLTATAPGVSVTNATSDSAGVATATLSIPSTTSSGQYSLTATVAGTSRSVTFPLTVSAVASSLSVALDNATLAQGQSRTITVTARDGAGVGAAGVAVSLVVTDASNAAAKGVYPKVSGCLTDSAGTCSVALLSDPNAPAGAYTLRASSGSLTAAAANITVTATPARIVPSVALTLAQGQTLSGYNASTGSGLLFSVLDGAGNPVANANLTLSPPPQVTVSPSSATSDGRGSLPVTLTAAPGAPPGSSVLVVVANGVRFELPVTVTTTFGSVTATRSSFPQGTTGNFTVLVSSPSGAPVANVAVHFSITQPGLTYTPNALTDANGVASSVVSLDSSVYAGSYPMLVTVQGYDTTVQLQVTPVPTKIAASGTVTQGATSQLVYTITDLAGQPISAMTLSLAGLPAKFSLAPGSMTSDAAGVVRVNVTDANSSAGTYSYTSSAGSLTVNQSVTVLAAPGQVYLSPSPLRLSAGTSSSANATVKDRAGDPYPGANLTFANLPSGASASPAGPTGANGVTAVSFTQSSAVFGGTYQLLASVGSLSASLPVTYVSSYSARALAAGATLLLPLDDQNANSANDLLGAHMGSYTLGTPNSVLFWQSSPLTGSHAVNFVPLDSNGNVALAAAGGVSVPDGGRTALPGTTSFTVAGWVNPASLAGIRSPFALTKGVPASGAPGLSIGASNSGTALAISLGDGGVPASQLLTLDPAYRPSTWVGKLTHVAVVVDRSAQLVRVYVNGVAQSSTMPITAVTGSLASGADLVLGQAGGYVLDGQMDELGVYPGVLSPAQIQALATP